jgi:hypothetical protein
LSNLLILGVKTKENSVVNQTGLGCKVEGNSSRAIPFGLGSKKMKYVSVKPVHEDATTMNGLSCAKDGNMKGARPGTWGVRPKAHFQTY